MYPHQAERLTGALERAELDALVATTRANVFYVTGFSSLSVPGTADAGVLAVFARRGTALVAPTVDAAAVAAEGVQVDHVLCHGAFAYRYSAAPGDVGRRVRAWVNRPAPAAVDALAAALDALGVRAGAIGLDEGGLAAAPWRRLAERLGPLRVVDGARCFAEARAVKSPYEIECLERALAIVEEGANAVLQMLKPAVTEWEAVAVYEGELVKRGASPSRSIVLMGERSALPAAPPSERALRPGDLVRLDVGCAFKGHHASVARVAVMGEPTPEQEAAYDAVQAGEAAAIDAVAPGARTGRIFKVAVEAVRSAGRPEWEPRHIGHGIGIEPAEAPGLAPESDDALEPGMVLGVEAADYEVGWGGLGVRDTVLVTHSGGRVLNRSARGLVVLD